MFGARFGRPAFISWRTPANTPSAGASCCWYPTSSSGSWPQSCSTARDSAAGKPQRHRFPVHLCTGFGGDPALNGPLRNSSARHVEGRSPPALLLCGFRRALTTRQTRPPLGGLRPPDSRTLARDMFGGQNAAPASGPWGTSEEVGPACLRKASIASLLGVTDVARNRRIDQAVRRRPLVVLKYL